MVAGAVKARVVGRRGQRNGGRQLVGDRHIGGGGSQGAAGIVNRLRGQAVAAGADAAPGKGVGRGGVLTQQGRAVVELDLGDGVAVGGDTGGEVDGGGRRESRVVGRRGQRNGGRQLVRDRHIGSGGSEGAAGIINDLRGKAVAAGANAAPGEGVGRSGVFTQQGCAVVELDAGDGVAVGGDAGGEVDGRRAP